MAVYRIFPEKDSFISSKPTDGGLYRNAGLDPILELAGYMDENGIGRSHRTLIQFKQSEITDALENKVSNAFTSNLHLYLAESSQVPTSYVVEAYPISSSWKQGNGVFEDSPANRSGVSWKYRDAEIVSWSLDGVDYLTQGKTFQSHSVYTDHDITVNVTDTIHSFYSSSYPNNGFLLKLNDEYENNTTSSISLKYFGSDTNTIFPPYLEFKWDDSTYNSNLPDVSTTQIRTNIKNNKPEFADSDTYRFRVATRPIYPQRSFVTSSVYTTNYKLPESSCWAIKDEYSEEMIIDFDSSNTKLSADNDSSYFDVYMDSLQPERFYRLLIKTTIDGSTVVLDDNNTFKVVRNG